MLRSIVWLALSACGGAPFAVNVVDEATGRAPLVELRTVHGVTFVTDSAGVAAVDEPGLMGRSVFFHVKSHGYEFPADGFGYRGKALVLEPGGAATLKVRRVNIAERLYRVTGAGVYRDTALTGGRPPTEKPLLNAGVLGSDSVQNAIFGGKLHWFWGDTSRAGYPLGNFHTPGATSDLPGQGGLGPEAGVDLHYFEAPDGFAAETAKLPGDGPTWVGGLAAFADEAGRERLFTGYVKVRPPLDVYQRGVAEFDPEARRFVKRVAFPDGSAVRNGGHVFLGREGGRAYLYFADPFPLTRVPAEVPALLDASRYESFTCLEANGGAGGRNIERDATGRPRYGWKANALATQPELLARLVSEKALKEDEAWPALRDVETGRRVVAHRGSVNWNAYRKRWVLIAVEVGGSASYLGEVWYAEADSPVGPWGYARKVATHDRYSFYNPKQHPYFDHDGGRTIFFEGTYSATFSGNPAPTPRYDYNQVLYKLDLTDPRLNLPVAVARLGNGSHSLGPAARGGRPAFFALDRPRTGTVPVFENNAGGGFAFAATGAAPLCHALAPAPAGPPGTRPLTDDGGRTIGLVWATPPGPEVVPDGPEAP